MTREELRLNDFEGFDRYLKTLETEEKTGWAMFYDEKSNIFTPPIAYPETLVEYQLDHYALWMVIHIFDLHKKPRFCYGTLCPVAKWYACEWKCKKSAIHSCYNGCPMISNTRPSERFCIDEYNDWVRGDNKSAYDIAHLKWRKI